MPTVGFEPTISVGEREQTYALDRSVTGTGFIIIKNYYYFTEVIEWRKIFLREKF